MLRLRNLLIGSLLVVWLLGCGGGRQVVGPPQIGSTSPSSRANISILPTGAIPGSADLTLVIDGSQTFSFPAGPDKYSKVVWSVNGSETELSATFVSSSQLTAIVPATLLSTQVTAVLRVEIWDHTNGTLAATSSSVSFEVTSKPPPSISSISPSMVAAGSPDVTITINGWNFGQYGHFIRSTAFWTTNGNLHDTGTWLQTTIVSSSQLTAVIPAKLLQSPTSVQIVVVNGDVMGMSDGFFGYPMSNLVTFTVTQ